MHPPLPPAVSAVLFSLLVLLPAILLVLYLAAARAERTRAAWSGWRSASFAAGCLLLMAAGAPPVTDWAHHDLRGHMVQHLLLGMFAPLALVLGAPGTLLLRRLPARFGKQLVSLLATLPARLLVHPLTAAVLDIGGMYLLYLTPLFALSQADGVLHVLVHVHFVVAGYLFAWSIAGPDPAPHRPGMLLRLAVLFLATALHGYLGKLMYGEGHPRGMGYPAEEIQAAAQLMYYGGDLAEAALAAAFFVTWLRRSARKDTADTGRERQLSQPFDNLSQRSRIRLNVNRERRTFE